MNTVEIEVPVEEAKRFANDLEGEAEEIGYALECLQNNGFSDTDVYWELSAIKSDKEEGVEQIRGQIDDQTEESNRGLEELFG